MSEEPVEGDEKKAVSKDDAAKARKVAFEALMKRIRSQPATNTPRTWTRDELYER